MLEVQRCPPLEELVSSASDIFRSNFKIEPTHCAFAPGRVNLIGEHVDYCDGFVLPMALPMYTVVVASQSGNSSCTVVAASLPKEETAHFSLPTSQEPLVPGDPFWSNYVKGVVANFPGSLCGFNAVVVSSVPIGAGLSSSAALEVATFCMLESLMESPLQVSTVEKALCCQRAEHHFAKVPCGIMDQFIAFMGQQDNALLLDCRSLEARQVPLIDPSVSVLIIDSNVKHKLCQGEYAKRRSDCEGAISLLGKSLRDATEKEVQDHKEQMTAEQFAAAHHVVTEIHRTTTAAQALESGNLVEFGRLMAESHTSLRDDFRVSCNEVDTLVELCLSIKGVYGSRMTGAGFGGCTVTLLNTEVLQRVIDHIENNYKGSPTFYVCKPSHGAAFHHLTPK
ncbi:galactokinase-like [Ornithodoros turicata]|uniref:galactokinase-like n=1 Tax=Ornithodoros turicata TaxID=34597 RepID=UPI00313944B4